MAKEQIWDSFIQKTLGDLTNHLMEGRITSAVWCNINKSLKLQK